MERREMVWSLLSISSICIALNVQGIEVRKPLIRMQGVRKVEYDIEKGEIKVHGKVDAKKVHQRIEKISKKKVEMVILDSKSKGKEEEKKETLSTTVLKVHLHCPKCEYDLKRVILKHKGVYSVKSYIKAQTLSVEGTIERAP